MAIYRITRTDAIQPGEFESAVVIAPGRDLARRAVAHFPGVKVSGKGRNIQAEPLDTTGAVQIVNVYEDEREPVNADRLTLDDVAEASYLN